MRSSRLLLLGLVSFSVSVACGSSSGGSSPSSGPDGGADAGSGGAVVRFDLTTSANPAFMAVPFPSDVYLQGGKVVVPNMDGVIKENSSFISSELAKMDGFSRVALSAFYVDDTSQPLDANGNPAYAKLDPKTFPADETACVADTSSVFLVDLAATDPTKARIACRGMYHQDFESPSSRTLAAVGPARGIVLQAAHPYAAVLTSRVKTTDGRALLASSDFQKVQQGASSAPAVYTKAYTAASKLLSSALAKDGATIVGIAPFTTHDMDKQLFTLRDGIESSTAPTMKWDAASMAPMSPALFAAPVGGALPMPATASLDDWLGVATKKLPDGTDDPDGTLPVVAHDQIAVVATGVFAANNYLTHYQGANYTVAGTATFSYDGSGNIVPAADAPTDKIWVSFAVPAQPMPSTGYPLVVFQHGLGGSREDFLTIANPLCQKGWMVAAIDSITFGARAPEAAYQVDKTSDFASAPGAKYSGPDGFADAVNGAHNGSTDLFGMLLNVGGARDQFRQAEIDTVQLVHVLRSKPDLSGLATAGATAPVIDASRVAYIGQSLGSLEGEVAAALEPNLSAWVFNVGGGGLIRELGTHSPIVGALLAEAAGLNFAFIQGTFDEGHLAMSLIQTILEPADALIFASDLITNPQPFAGQPTKPRNLLQTEVLYDEWVPNESNEAFARAGGWGLAAPNQGSNAGILDYKNLANDVGRLPLASTAAQSDGTIHDTPMAGVTAVVVQSSPATHGDNLTSSTGSRQFCIPFANYATGMPFVMVNPFDVSEPYLQTQAAATSFLADAFAGKVPRVTVPKPPVRDLDGDTYTDDVDAFPCDPTKH
jgi:dienelactone hydrolase